MFFENIIFRLHVNFYIEGYSVQDSCPATLSEHIPVITQVEVGRGSGGIGRR